jgi:5-formyltetrahydrofolate cyclo-ligase
VGLAFDCQMVDDLPLEAHDVQLDKVATETTLYTSRR